MQNLEKESNYIIDIHDLSFSYQKEQAVLQNVDLQILEGEAVGIIGANGSGKSTLFKLLTGLLTGNGKIVIDGLELQKNNLSQIRQRLGVVFQDSDNQLFMPTVYEDLIFAPRNYGMSEQEAETAVIKALQRMDIEHLKDRQNYRISGGEKRMVCIATALVMEPKVLLMDEPSNMLDPYHRRILIQSLNKIPETKLIASHDLDLVYETCARVILLGQGGIVADGPATTILQDEALLRDCRLELPLSLQTIQPFCGKI